MRHCIRDRRILITGRLILMRSSLQDTKDTKDTKVMKITCAILVLIAFISIIPLGSAGTAISVHPGHAMVIEGVIAEGNLIPLGKALIDITKSADEKYVDLVINSPGGEVRTGFVFISMMEAAKKLGLHINCFVPTLAASMAFSILNHCDDRYVLDKSFLLWHRARVMLGGLGSSPITAPQAQILADDLQKLDTSILTETTEALKIKADIVEHHFEAETLHIGADLATLAPKFCTSYHDIPGIFEVMMDGHTLRNPQVDMRRMFRPGNAVYISPRILIQEISK